MSAPHNTETAGRTPRDDRYFFTDSETPTTAPEVFAGLTPRVLAASDAPESRMPQTLRNGLPLLMTGSLAAGVGVTTSLPIHTTADAHSSGEIRASAGKHSLSELISQAFAPLTHSVVKNVAPHIPETYRVKKGDTLSSVAAKFDIPTTLLLTLNGLSWNSILHEGQVVRLTPGPSKTPVITASPTDTHYTVSADEALPSVADRLGVPVRTLAAANGLSPEATLTAGDTLVIPETQVDRAPRVTPASLTGQPRIVWASTDDQPIAEGEDSEASEESTTQSGDPADWDVAEAPALRPVKPATPPPPPPAPKKEEVKKAETPRVEQTQDNAAPTQAASKPTSGAITPLNDTRRKNASVIVQVGRELGVPDYGIVIALATAMQESSLRNIDWGDRDSVGLFQQRPSSGWGSVEQIMDPVFASKAFYGGPQNPNAGRTRGLLDYSGWQSMSLTVAAQKVQRSAYPEAYAKWEASAWAWLEELS